MVSSDSIYTRLWITLAASPIMDYHKLGLARQAAYALH